MKRFGRYVLGLLLAGSMAGCGVSGQNVQKQAEQSSASTEREDLEVPEETNKALEDQAQAASKSPEEETKAIVDGAQEETAVYRGIANGSQLQRKDVFAPGAKVYRFEVEGTEYLYALKYDESWLNGMTADSDQDGVDDYLNVKKAEEGAYALENQLIPEREYRITVKDDTVLEVSPLADVAEPAFQRASAGEHTLKNFLAMACEPMGKTLYVYGGGWDMQDIGSSDLARTIGVSQTWQEFFDRQDTSYNYKGESIYPYQKWNCHYEAGLDCSGFVGWTLYNTMYDRSLQYPGFVQSATKMARSLAQENGLGEWVHADLIGQSAATIAQSLRPGDIVSIPGHVYIVVGTCSDGSVVILHSTVSDSVTGEKGGGVQLSAISPNGTYDTGCEAFALASSYTKQYAPQWAQRYLTVMKPQDLYFNFGKEESCGVFHWTIGESGLMDPQDYTNKSAKEILQDLFDGS